MNLGDLAKVFPAGPVHAYGASNGPTMGFSIRRLFVALAPEVEFENDLRVNDALTGVLRNAEPLAPGTHYAVTDHGRAQAAAALHVGMAMPLVRFGDPRTGGSALYAGARFKLIATDGVFSMDGYIANLAGLCDLADKYHALVMVDDSHAVGFMGRTGRGTPEHCGVMGRIDILTGTLGKALGGASGGYTSGRQEIIDLLRQRSRPYLFSNTLAPVIAAASLHCLDLLSRSTALRDQLEDNTRFFRDGLAAAGLKLRPGNHPIVPVMLGDAALAQKFAARMLEKGVYVIGFFYPVVPQGLARIRTQVSAAHSRADLAFAIEKFAEVKQEFGL